MFFFPCNADLDNLKAIGEAPEWMQPEGYLTLFGTAGNTGYLMADETPKGLYTRLAQAAAFRLNRPDLEDNFFEMLWKGWLGVSSPILSNFGAERGLPISCYSSMCEDTMKGIIAHVNEQSHLTWNGGGVATHLTALRPVGSTIKSGGLSDGILSPLRMLNACVPTISQNSMRRGSIAAYLDIDHPDIQVFLRMRQPEVDEEQRFMKMHHGVCITNAFVERLKNNEQEAIQLWGQLLTLRMETGEPYLIFSEAANRDNPPAYVRLGLKVNGSNLCCLEASCEVITSEGVQKISEILDQKVQIWDGMQWTTTVFEYMGDSSELIKVEFADGTSIKVTPGHKFPTQNGMLAAWALTSQKDTVIVDTSNLSSDTVRGEIISAELINLENPQPMYCCTVPTSGMFALADGRMTGNSEIFLATSPDYTLVCCLSSLNVALYDEWKDRDIIELAVYFLDAVMSEFLERAKKLQGLENAVRFAEKSRALGLGVLGYHTYLQSKSIPFESPEAKAFNIELFTEIQRKSQAASITLGKTYGVPEWCTELGRRHTHLCVSGDTTVLTKLGQKPIQDLVGQDIEIWNGFEWSLVNPFQTRKDTDLYKVEIEGGYSLTCTPDHRWFIQNDRSKLESQVETQNLKAGDKLAKWTLPTVDGSASFPFAYTSGFFTGDGSYSQSKPKYSNCKQRKEIRLYGTNNSKHQCLEKLHIKAGCSVRACQEEKGLRLYVDDRVADKFVVPTSDCKLEDKLNWLAGYFDADGSSQGSLCSINLECLRQVQVMAQSVGLFSRLVVRERLEPSSTLYTLLFSSVELSILNDYTCRVKFNKKTEKRQYLKVVAITKVANGNSFCLTDSLRGSCLFNGIRTAQCALAPTLTNSTIMGVSRAIEPIEVNAGFSDGAKGTFAYANNQLIPVLEKYGRNSDIVWRSIAANAGSVQHLNFLSDHEREVFKTAREIDQRVLVQLAGDRGGFIDQGQSLNLFYYPDADPHLVHEAHWLALTLGLKALYYLKTASALKTKTSVDYSAATAKVEPPSECTVCQ